MTAQSGQGPGYPIRAVSRMTGLSVDTLRAWERRYEAVVPGRGERGRLYSDADVARLQQLGTLVRRGHAIGAIADLPPLALATLVSQGETHAAPSSDRPTADLEPLSRALDTYDMSAIEAILNRHAVILPADALIFSVVVPLLRDLGDRWAAGRLRPSQEHLISAVVRSLLGGLLRAASPAASLQKPTMVCATPVGERHELGLLCAALLAASAGYGVLYLGTDLAATDIGHAARATRTRVVLLSVTTGLAVGHAEAAALAKMARGFELWVGGPAASALLAEMGGRARHVAALDDLLPMLASHAR